MPCERVQLVHKDVRSTQIYTHLINRGGAAVVSPLNDLFAKAGRAAAPPIGI